MANNNLLLKNTALIFLIILSLFIFASCDLFAPIKIEIENQKQEFYIGEDFSIGDEAIISFYYDFMPDLEIDTINCTDNKTTKIIYGDSFAIDYSNFKSDIARQATIYVYYYSNSKINKTIFDSYVVNIIEKTNQWTTTPSISNWCEGSQASTPNGSALYGNTTFEYKLANQNDSFYSTTQPTAKGKYVMKATAEAFGYKTITKTVNFEIKAPISGDLKIHVLELGNEYAGDCVYIQVGTTDILIDGGSRESSVNTIYDYVSEQMVDDKIEYVIVTHADKDHIAAFAGNGTYDSLFDKFQCETIIDFAKTNKTTQVYNKYITERDNEVANGAKHYTAEECWQQTNGAQRVYDLGNGIELEFLDNTYYRTNSSDENNYSVCFIINQGSRHFLFTGDLEKEGEEYLIEHNNLPVCDFYKANHHGSKTSSSPAFLAVIQPKIIATSCVAGSVEYSGNDETTQKTFASAEYKDFMKNTFPTQTFINNIASYTSQVYVTRVATVAYNTTKGKYENTNSTAMNGNIVVSSSAGSEISVNCSNNNTYLKDTAWLSNNRNIPSYWAN